MSLRYYIWRWWFVHLDLEFNWLYEKAFMEATHALAVEMGEHPAAALRRINRKLDRL